jgi:hypothetical protein
MTYRGNVRFAVAIQYFDVPKMEFYARLSPRDLQLLSETQNQNGVCQSQHRAICCIPFPTGSARLTIT